MFDLKSYLLGKHGGAYSASLHLPSYLMGRKKSVSIKTLTGKPPLMFSSDGSNLVDYTIYGASGGVGDKTANLFDGTYLSYGINSQTGEVVQANRFAFYIPVEPNTSYTISRIIGASSYFYYGFTDEVPTAGVRCVPFGNIGPDVTTKTLANENHKYLMFFFGAGKSENVMLTEGSTAPDHYIPYGSQIPLTINSQTYTIYLDAPLGEGESISLADTGIDIPTVKGENTLSVDTTVQPENVTIVYMGKKRSSKKKLYGYHIDGATGNVSYITGTDNENFTPAEMGSTTFDYGSWQDAFFMPKPCMLKSNGTVDYCLDPNDYSKKLDGTPSDIADPDYDGNVMVEFPKIYYAAIGATEGGSVDIYIANYKVDDRFECWCNYDANNNEIDHFYVSAYDIIILDGKMRSLSGYALTQANGADTTTLIVEIAAARANNQNGIDEWYIYLLADHQLLTCLATLICKHANHQTKFGRGMDEVQTSGKRAYVAGTLNDKGLFWGVTTNGYNPVKIFGIENFYACMWKRAAGLFGTSTGYAYKLTHGTKDGSTATSFNTDGSGYKPVVITKPASGAITTMHYESNGLWIPATTGTNLYGDYVYPSNGYANVGGGGALSTQAGSWSTYFDTPVNWNISTRLSCKPLAR